MSKALDSMGMVDRKGGVDPCPWAAWVKLLQEDQAQKQKDANDGLVHCIAELQQQ